MRLPSNQEAEISLYGRIGLDNEGNGISAKAFVSELKQLGSSVTTINLHINSPGGSVWDGNAIFTALSAHPAKIHVHIDGAAFSMASIIAMAGDDISMASNALMMIHLPAMALAGTSSDFRRYADMLDKLTTTAVRAYASRTGLDEAMVRQLMTDETWMDATEARRLGFVDHITHPLPAVACITASEASQYQQRLPAMATPFIINTPTQTQETTPMDDPTTDTPEPQEDPQEEPTTEPQEDPQPPADPPDGDNSGIVQCAATFDELNVAFGPAKAGEYYAQKLPLVAAVAAYRADTDTTITQLRTQLAEHQTQEPAAGFEPRDEQADAQLHARQVKLDSYQGKLPDNLARTAAGITIRHTATKPR